MNEKAILDLLADASKHAEDNLTEATNASHDVEHWNPYRLHAAHAYAAAVDGNTRAVRAALQSSDYPPWHHKKVVAAGLRRIGKAASTCGAPEGAADIVERSFRLADKTRYSRSG